MEFFFLSIFINPINNPRVINAPAGRIMITQGSKLKKPKMVPDPRISRIVPNTKSAKVKPTHIPKASTKAGRGLCLDAKTSALPRIRQFTTINGTKGPRAFEISGKFPLRKRSATVTNVAITMT